MTTAPVSVGERVEELDVLRGVALFGVFLMNMVGFGDAMSTEQQLLSLPTAAADFTLEELAAWLVADKANTLFAFLFGLGFYLQMQRLGARGADFDRIYLRRLTFLLVLGLVHAMFVCMPRRSSRVAGGSRAFDSGRSSGCGAPIPTDDCRT